MFAIFLVCLFLISGVLFGFFFVREQSAIQTENKTGVERSIGYSMEYLQNLVQNEYLGSLNLRSTPWVIRISSGSEVFREQFTARSLQEVSSDFLFNMSLNTDVLYRIVFFSKNSLVISKQGLNDAEYYFQWRGVPDDQIEAFLGEISSATSPRSISYKTDSGEPGFAGNILLLNPIQDTRNPSAYLCTMLNATVIRQQITQLLPDCVTGFRITEPVNGETVLSAGGEPDRKVKIMSGYSVPMLEWQVEFYVDESLYPVPQEAFRWATLLFAVMLLSIVPAAFFLAMYIYWRLAKLFRKLPAGKVSRDIYRDVSDSISSLVQTVKSNEKETCLRQLVAGTLKASDPIPATLPDYQKLFVQTVLLRTDEIDPDYSVFTAELDVLMKDVGGVHVESIIGYDNMQVLIFSSSREETLSALDAAIVEKLTSSGDLFFGSICKGHIGIAISFQAALKKKQYWNFSGVPNYYLPIDMEHQLLLALRSGKEAETADILNSLLDKNDILLQNGTIRESDIYRLSTVLTNDLVRIVVEKNLGRELLDSLEDIEYSSVYDVFGKLNSVAVEICAMLVACTDSTNTVAQKIVYYIDEHYADSALSIMLLQDVFGMSANTINKNIKEVVGSTFLPYLTYVRMEKAKELLAAGDMKISEVCRQVGYDQEYSFRRAFVRYSGYKPQNFIAPGEDTEV